MNKLDDLITKIDELIEQSVKDNSHYYTASVLKEVREFLNEGRAVPNNQRMFKIKANSGPWANHWRNGNGGWSVRAGKVWTGTGPFKNAVGNMIDGTYNVVSSDSEVYEYAPIVIKVSPISDFVNIMKILKND